jgi:hypothetical protein
MSSELGRIMSGRKLGDMIVEALGITHPVRSIKIELDWRGEPALVTIESFVRDEQGKKLAILLTEGFELRKRSEEQTPLV